MLASHPSDIASPLEMSTPLKTCLYNLFYFGHQLHHFVQIEK